MNYTHLKQSAECSDMDNASRSKSLLTFDKACRIVLLFDAEDYDGVVPFISHIETAGKQLRAWSFSPSYKPARDKKFDRSYRMFVMNKHHFSRKCLPLEWVENDFRCWKPDLLIDLSRRENPVLEYFATKSQAVFKIGLKATVPQRYELIYDASHTDGDISTHASQLMKYYRDLRPSE